jgi:propionyl-CoA carboxylase alpha chain
MFYDSMIAKLIVHGRDRNDAIAKMREALNAFVIRGISSNIPFQSALLAHPRFVSGEFNTGFIAEQYAHGFRAQDVTHQDPDFLIALAAFVRRRSRERAASLSGQLPGYDVKVGQAYTIITLDVKGDHQHTQVEVDDSMGRHGTAIIKVNGKNYAIASESRINDVAIQGTVNGQPFVAQVERGSSKNPLGLQIQHNGTRIDAMVVSPRMAELYKLMPFKAPPDLSRFVLSPMPGLLVDVAVKPGQKVLAGERVAVIEAMKMENVLFALQDGVVKSVVATQGESLTVDQVIVEFEA